MPSHLALAVIANGQEESVLAEPRPTLSLRRPARCSRVFSRSASSRQSSNLEGSHSRRPAFWVNTKRVIVLMTTRQVHPVYGRRHPR